MIQARGHTTSQAKQEAIQKAQGPGPGRLAVALLWLIAAVWVFAGVAKVVDLAVRANDAAASASEPAWADQFPAWLIALVAAAEVAVGVTICVGWRRTGIAVACALLSAFAITLWIIPPEPAQPCGCLGVADPVFDAVPVHAKITVFGGLQAVLCAMVVPVGRRQE